MPKEYRTDVFNTTAPEGARHVVEYWHDRGLALAYLDAMRERGASAGFLLRYWRTGLDGQDYYNAEEVVY